MVHLIKIFIFLFIPIFAFSTVVPERDTKNRVISRSAGIPVDSSARVRFIGTHDFNISGNSSASQDWVVPQLTYNGVNVNSIISGVEYKTVGGCDGDKIKFSIRHSQTGELDAFAQEFYVFKDEKNIIKEYKADLPAGLVVRVDYTSTCANAARFISNLYRYIEVE